MEHGKLVYELFARWAKSGALEKLLETFKESADNEWLSIDSSCIKVHKHGSGPQDRQKKSIERSKGGITAKIHAVTDALGNPLKIILSAGNVHDSKLAEELPFGMEAKAVLADKGYNSKKIEALIKEINSEVVISLKNNEINPIDYDKHLYKERHAIEYFFQKIKESRRAAARYDKLQIMYKNFVLIACCLVWLR